MNDPGEYYAQKQREARALADAIEEHRKQQPKDMASGAWSLWESQLRALNRKLELARYTGD